MVNPDKHKQAILSKARRVWFGSLAEINQRYESDIREFATIIAERRASEHLRKERMAAARYEERNFKPCLDRIESKLTIEQY